MVKNIRVKGSRNSQSCFGNHIPAKEWKGVRERLRFADQVKRGLFKHLSRTGIRSTGTGSCRGTHSKGEERAGASGAQSVLFLLLPLSCLLLYPLCLFSQSQPCLHVALVPSQLVGGPLGGWEHKQARKGCGCPFCCPLGSSPNPNPNTVQP